MRTVCGAAASGTGREGRKEDLPAVRHMGPAGPQHGGDPLNNNHSGRKGGGTQIVDEVGKTTQDPPVLQS